MFKKRADMGMGSSLGPTSAVWQEDANWIPDGAELSWGKACVPLKGSREVGIVGVAKALTDLRHRVCSGNQQ